jgi:hypothetical protein
MYPIALLSTSIVLRRVFSLFFSSDVFRVVIFLLFSQRKAVESLIHDFLRYHS